MADDRNYDEPRRRSRREYDDDWDDSPRRPAKAGIGVGLILAIIFGVLVACGGLGALLLLPAVSKVKEAAGRMKDSNNLKQIGLGMYNDDNVHGRGFYAPLAHDKDGNVVSADLSFRVSLLPYIEQEYLYRQFDPTQGWSSPRNRTYSFSVVPQYACPTPPAAGAPLHLTPYRAFVGGGAMFNDNGLPVPVSQIPDGAGNTIMLIAVADEVPWAQPMELTYNPANPLPTLGTRATPTGSNVLLADGSVRFLRKTTPDPVFRALITRAGNDTVPVDW